ncbi:MAG: ATP-grasp domain-containing protein [Coriobacteriales bacterium]|jgi:hypothetical protein|nr:ATP-grasp domain-containing protein [Coriobacteriales bacterium]
MTGSGAEKGGQRDGRGNGLGDEKIRVLIFPAGAENALDIFDALRYSLRIEVFGASGKSDHASFVYPEGSYFEGDYYLTDAGFIDTFNSLIDENAIDVVIPTHDTVALFLAQHRGVLNACVLTSSADTALVCREKRRTFAAFAEEDFCPAVYGDETDVPPGAFPVFLKPNVGEGGRGTVFAADASAVRHARSADPDLVICEYLPGEELTVDCFSDRKGHLHFVGPRQRDRIQMGISFRSHTLPLSEDIQAIAERINTRLDLFGGWFFQLKQASDGRYKLMEVACRHAGTMALYRHKGVNFALLGVLECMGIDTEVIENPGTLALDRCLRARYAFDFSYQHVYLDFDDTLVIDGQVNRTAIAFLYQCANNKKEVTLLTRHARDIRQSLKKYRIDPGLFVDIVSLDWGQNKVDFIRIVDSILIDNSFAERKSASDALGIPVFDVDAVDALLLP